MKRLSSKHQESGKAELPAEFLHKHKDILDAVKSALNFIEPNYNEDDSDNSSGSSHSSYESSSYEESDSDNSN